MVAVIRQMPRITSVIRRVCRCSVCSFFRISPAIFSMSSAVVFRGMPARPLYILPERSLKRSRRRLRKSRFSLSRRIISKTNPAKLMALSLSVLLYTCCIIISVLRFIYLIACQHYLYDAYCMLLGYYMLNYLFMCLLRYCRFTALLCIYYIIMIFIALLYVYYILRQKPCHAIPSVRCSLSGLGGGKRRVPFPLNRSRVRR